MPWCHVWFPEAIIWNKFWSQNGSELGGQVRETANRRCCLCGSPMSVQPAVRNRLQMLVNVPSGKRLHNYGKSPWLMGKSTMNVVEITECGMFATVAFATRFAPGSTWFNYHFQYIVYFNWPHHIPPALFMASGIFRRDQLVVRSSPKHVKRTADHSHIQFKIYSI